MERRSRHSEQPVPRLDAGPGEAGLWLCAELHIRRSVTILTVHGDIDAYTRDRWRDLLDNALSTAEKYGRLIVHVGDARFIGCRPVLDLALIAQQGAARGVEVAAIDPAPSVLDRIITITGLAEWLPVYTDSAEVPAERLTQAPTPIASRAS